MKLLRYEGERERRHVVRWITLSIATSASTTTKTENRMENGDCGEREIEQKL